MINLSKNLLLIILNTNLTILTQLELIHYKVNITIQKIEYKNSNYKSNQYIKKLLSLIMVKENGSILIIKILLPYITNLMESIKKSLFKVSKY